MARFPTKIKSMHPDMVRHIEARHQKRLRLWVDKFCAIVAIISLFLPMMLRGWTLKLEFRGWTRSFRFKYAAGSLDVDNKKDNNPSYVNLKSELVNIASY